MKFLESKKGKNFMAKLYGIGAAVVILGALFKIQHWTFADEMLIVGLGTEAIIFFFSAFEKPHAEYDWSLVYPELAGMNDDSMSPVRELDNMLEKAKVDGELIKSLGEGLRKVNKAANGIGSVTDIADSTQEYSKQVTAAAKKLENINGLYEAQIASSTEQTEATRRMASNMTASLDNAQQMQVELEMLSKNLNALNGVYGNMLNAMNYNK
ncbi:MAG: gliding motility protein GldL [Flavobacteriales bacterium]|jgi:gliding motility-associated protein GldL|tara:strand:- start:718 stop:1350 length:633 start_codon:yes stop_codon:yes gene_type:complete